jgi:hypothetical protein
MAATDGGIFGGDRDEIVRGVAELERKEAAAAKLAAEQAEYAADLEATLDRIEKEITVYVADELQAEFAAQRQAEEARKRAHMGAFLRFKQYCIAYSTPLPYLPASPVAISAFLATEIAKGPAHLNRLNAAIAVMHRRVNLPDPSNDPLIKAVIRLSAYKDKSPTAGVNTPS